MRSIFLRIAISILSFCSIEAVQAQAVISDPGFGSTGVRTFLFPDQGFDATTACILPLPNHQIVAGTHATIRINNGASPSRLHYKIVKLNENGSYDGSFGTNGFASIDLGPRASISPDNGANRLALQADGKIVGTASIYNLNTLTLNVLVFRLKVNGTLDSSFGINGLIRIPIGNGNSQGRGILVHPDGKIIVAATYWLGTANSNAIIQLLPNGTPDNSFVGNGIRTFHLGASNESPKAILLQPDGKLLIAVSVWVNDNNDMAVARMNPDGSFDNSFNGVGWRSLAFGAQGDIIEDIALQPDNKIVLAGWMQSSPNLHFAVARLNANGSIDNSFDGDGKNTLHFGNSTNHGYSVVLQSDGKIIMGGDTHTPTGDFEFALCRFNTNGSIDSSFHVNGRKVFNLTTGYDISQDMVMLPNGKILMGGSIDAVPGVMQTSIIDPQGADCNTINVQTNLNQMNISGLGQAAIATVQLFNSSWASVFQQTYTNPPDAVDIPSLAAGQYFVKVNFYTNNWTPVCEKTGFHNVSGEPADDDDSVDCDKVGISPVTGAIRLTGLVAPLITVHIFDSSWATVYNQIFTNSPDSVLFPAMPGIYHVKINFYTAGWSLICEHIADVRVSVGQCPPGAICVTNVCPQPVVNLDTVYSIPRLPAGTTITWHSGTPATNANKLTASQIRNVGTSGTYYAAIHIAGSDCYSETIMVVVTIDPCVILLKAAASSVVTDKAQTSDERILITVAPNPFNNFILVNIGSDKSEKAELFLMDLSGRSLIKRSVQLQKGSNRISINELHKFPAGSYLLKVATAGRSETMRVVKIN
ncbi:MAG TPA: T9SS type A sorting domain-containing protein [Chitinophagaceae bacterium]